MPKVSIIVPTYNGEKFIARALTSILNQSFQDFEVVVIDDVSHDRTVEIVKQFQKKDQRIKFIGLEKNSGGGAVPRTTGCKAAKGDLVAFLDQDDLYMSEYLETGVTYFDRHPEINSLSGIAWIFDEEKKKIIDWGAGGWLNIILKKEALEAVGYLKESQTNVDDAGMWWRYYKVYGSEKRLVTEDNPLTLYSRHAGQGSDAVHGDPRIFIKRIDSLLADVDQQVVDSTSKNFLSYLYSRKANFYCLAGNFKAGRHFFFQSLKQRFNIFSFILLLISFFPWFYKIFVLLARFFQSRIIEKKRLFIKRTEYKKSYQSAQKILDDISKTLPAQLYK